MPIHFNHQLGSFQTLLQERAIKEALLTLYTFCGAKKEDHLIFTSSGAEAVNHVVWAAYLDITRKTGKNHFLCSSLDEAPAIMAMSRLQECGCLFHMVPATAQGVVTAKHVAEMITPRTALFSMSWANGLTGVVQPVKEIAELCRERGILLHVDATHVLGKGPFSLPETGADVMTFNGPIGGTGFLIFPAGREMSPLILGGGQQGEMRGGAYSIQALLELAKWAQEEMAHTDHYGMEISRLRAHFEELICEALPGAYPLYGQQLRTPHITSLYFPGVTSDSLYFLLLQKGIHTTFGGGHFQHFSHILKACGLQEPEVHSPLSFAFSHTLTEEEVVKGANEVIASVRQLQKASAMLVKEEV